MVIPVFNRCFWLKHHQYLLYGQFGNIIWLHYDMFWKQIQLFSASITFNIRTVHYQEGKELDNVFLISYYTSFSTDKVGLNPQFLNNVRFYYMGKKSVVFTRDCISIDSSDFWKIFNKNNYDLTPNNDKYEIDQETKILQRTKQLSFI